MSWVSKEKLLQIVNESCTRREVLLKLGKSERSGPYITLKKYLFKYNIDVAHFSNKNTHKGKMSLEQILKKDVRYSSSRLKKRLIEENILKNECSICGLEPFWNDKPLVHVLDHINGIHTDNRIENLRIICRCCDSQLETFCKKKIGKKYFCGGCGKEIRKNISEKCISCYLKTKTKLEKKCPDCNKPIRRNSKKCKSCENKSRDRKHLRKAKRPSYEQLLQEVEELGYCSVGRKYNVTDNTIRKWLKLYQKS